jgi:general secretion pathway protein D
MKSVKFILCLLLVFISFDLFAQSGSLRSVRGSIDDKYGEEDDGGSTVTEISDEEEEEDLGYIEEDTPPLRNEVERNNQPKPQAPEEELVYLNAIDTDIKELIKQIAQATGTNFLIEDRLKGKITILSEKPMTKSMAYQAFLSALEVMGYTTVNTPGGLVKIINTKEAVTEPIDIFTENTPNTDKFITRIVQMQNISANDISTVVKSLVSKEGNLFAYPQTNSLIITDSGSNIDRILRIAKELDREGPQEVIEIIPIVNADAGDISEKVLELFENQFEDDSKSTTTRRRRSRRNTTEKLDEAPSLSKVISDERTNSVIILGSKRAIIKVKALIARLDTPGEGVEGKIHVYYLKHANSTEMAEVLSNLVSGTSSRSSKSKKDDNSGAVQLEGGVKVTADASTNSLVITASPKDYETLINQVINKLDIPRRQVFLEAMVMELTVTKSKTLGLSGNFGKIFNIGGESITGFGGLSPLFSNAISSIAGAAGGISGGGFSDRTISIGSGDTAVEIPAISAIIQALQTDNNVNVLSTPSILTLDNQEAKIQVGQEVPVRSGRTVSTTGENFSITREDTGVILTVTPQTSESDTVRLNLSQEISDVASVGSEDGPTFSKRTVDTVVVAHDKQTIVIGGLISDSQDVTIGKVPFLGDVPIIGNLFKNKQVNKRKSNIIVFLTPYIIRDKSDYLAILEKKVAERNLFLELNYGVSQRKQIRKGLESHASNLLQYVDRVNAKGNPTDITKSYYEEGIEVNNIDTGRSSSPEYQAPVKTTPIPSRNDTSDDYDHPTRRVREFDY